MFLKEKIAHESDQSGSALVSPSSTIAPENGLVVGENHFFGLIAYLKGERILVPRNGKSLELNSISL